MRDSIIKLEQRRREALMRENPYQFINWRLYDMSNLRKITSYKRSGNSKGNKSYANCFIMADTETSKDPARAKAGANHVVIWTISLRSNGFNWFTLWGYRPSELVKCIMAIKNNLTADETIIYWHNMAYDWVFIRKFIFREIGHPKKQLSTKPHYPILFKWSNGLIFKDSYILAQRSLEKWADDMNVEHKKAVGKWDYDIIRHQGFNFIEDSDEGEYIEHDTLAGVECLDAMRQALNKTYGNMPYTATGIPREALRKRAFKDRGRHLFMQCVPTYEQYIKLEHCYHGGYTHCNRYLMAEYDAKMLHDVRCYDFTSSYLWSLLAGLYPIEKFSAIDFDITVDDILNDDKYGYIFKLTMVNVELKDLFEPMPALQFSKCINCVGEVLDNGRITSADYVEIYLNDIDLEIIAEQYKATYMKISECECAMLGYLPRWLTDYVYECFTNKQKLKNVDAVLYALAKGAANSCYGMMCMHSIRAEEIENFITGEYEPAFKRPDDITDDQWKELQEQHSREEYEKFVNNKNSFLCYQWGVWCTSISMRQLFKLGDCINKHDRISRWIYSDTDSAYSDDWNLEKLEAFNEETREALRRNNYGAVTVNGVDYWLGVAVTEGDKDYYTEFVALGAKRYAGRCKKDGQIHITVAGVPKIGYKSLNDNLNTFKKGAVFNGLTTGKKTHFYIYVDDIYIDDYGNEIGDSIDLQPCDYILDEGAIDPLAFFDDMLEGNKTIEYEVQQYEEY